MNEKLTEVYKISEVQKTPKNISEPTAKNIIAEYKRANLQYVNDVRAYITAHLKETAKANKEYFGKIIKFPFADSYAFYMVVSVGKVNKVIFLDIYDGWNYPHINNVTDTEIKNMLENGCMFEEFEEEVN